jgi:multiple sugar transport system ATP-binding protein
VFVAGFIGSPAMNFFDATMNEKDGGLVLDTGVFALAIPANRAAPYRSHIGKKVVLGIRPEDIHDIEFQPQGIVPIQGEANVDVVEQMGNEMIVYLEEGGKNFIARTDPRTTARIGGRMGIVFNMANMHVFDADTQLSLAYEHKQEENAAKA